MEDDLAYFLELRTRLRGRRGATALVDRCILLIARAATAPPAELAALEREVEAIRSELVARFGPKPPLRVH